MAEFHNQEAASDAFGVNVETLQKWKDEKWFPKEGWIKGKGYDIDAIRLAKVLPSEGNDPVYPIHQEKFMPTCPKGKDHKARVMQTKGRTRIVVCDTCGHDSPVFQQIGEYANVALETLRRMAVMFENAPRAEVPDGKGGKRPVCFFEPETIKQAGQYCRAAIKARQ